MAAGRTLRRVLVEITEWEAPLSTNGNIFSLFSKYADTVFSNNGVAGREGFATVAALTCGWSAGFSTRPKSLNGDCWAESGVYGSILKYCGIQIGKSDTIVMVWEAGDGVVDLSS